MGEGGTLGTHPSECDEDDSVVRVGVAKTKGKFRVVTMQSARVKRVLSPVHSALYDHISSFGWCVRGDVQKGDFESVFNDVREGEEIISGDYEAATNNIYLDAVNAIVEVLGEDPDLTEEERKVLIGSFTNLRWKSVAGKLHPIRRGSMMGNLVSFPLLCLLNKACFDIASDIQRGSGERRVGRFNGDDCLFAGNREFYQLWETVTGTYGLVVNRVKTGIDLNWADLNSQPYLRGRGLIPRPCLSFLRPFRKEPDGLLREVYMGIRSLKKSTQAWVFNVAMRHEISLREINVSDLPRRTVSYLLTKSWFRRALEIGPAPIICSGVERKVPVVVANPPRSEVYRFVTDTANRLQAENVAFWLGKKVCPARRIIDRRAFYLRTSSIPTKNSPWYKEKGAPKWQFVWPQELYSFMSLKFPHLLLSDEECHDEWIDDHPFLKTVTNIVNTTRRSQYQFSFSPPPLFDSIPVDGVYVAQTYRDPSDKIQVLDS